jgi:hypothetical protein
MTGPRQLARHVRRSSTGLDSDGKLRGQTDLDLIGGCTAGPRCSCWPSARVPALLPIDRRSGFTGDRWCGGCVHGGSPADTIVEGELRRRDRGNSPAVRLNSDFYPSTVVCKLIFFVELRNRTSGDPKSGRPQVRGGGRRHEVGGGGGEGEGRGGGNCLDPRPAHGAVQL